MVSTTQTEEYLWNTFWVCASPIVYTSKYNFQNCNNLQPTAVLEYISSRARAVLCQENCSARTDSILLCGFDTVLWRRNSKSVTVRWRQLGGLCSIMVTLCLSTQTAPYNSHRRHCTAGREPYSSLSTPVRSWDSRLVVNTHRVKHHSVLLVQQLPKARVRALSRWSGRVP